MRLKRFRARGIHGYLNFNLLFYKDLTCLTGINGSGKTSVVHSIVALITPSLRTLADMQFESIALTIDDEGKEVEIHARQSEGEITLSITGVKDTVSFIPPSELPEERTARYDEELFDTFEHYFDDSPVIRAIKGLPTPMFLNLDRRVSDENLRRRRSTLLGELRQSRNVFGASLLQSLREVRSLARDASREVIMRQRLLDQDFQRKAVLDAFTITPSASGPGLPLIAPSQSDIDTIRRLRDAIPRISQILRVEQKEVLKSLGKALELGERLLKKIPAGMTPRDVASLRDEEKIEYLIEWSINKPLFDRNVTLLSNLDWYEAENEKIQLPINRYLDLVNKFLRDSDKWLSFDDRGILEVNIGNQTTGRPIESLSSGEAQIVVIITHLFFNEAAQKANVFIIDEPELSLHIQWQEMFVETLLAANPNIQLLLATHSPSIIQDYLNRCRDLSPKAKKKKRSKSSK